MYTFIPRNLLKDLHTQLGAEWPADILDPPINATELWQYELPAGKPPKGLHPDFDLSQYVLPGMYTSITFNF